MANLSNNDIAKAIYLEIKDQGSSKESLKKVVAFLDRKHLLGKTNGILEALEKILGEKEGTLTVKVKSVSVLSDRARTHIRSSLKKRYDAKDVILKEEVDSRLLGGMRLEINDEVIDMTMRNKINQLQKYLTRPA